PCQGAQSKHQGTWTCCCWTKRERSRSGTAPRLNSFPAPGFEEAYLADAAQLSSLADETPEGRSICCARKGALPAPWSRSFFPRCEFHPILCANENVRRGHRRSRNPQWRSGGNWPLDGQSG